MQGPGVVERGFSIVCDRGCDLPSLYIERAQVTLVGAGAQTLGTQLSPEELTEEFVRTYRALAASGSPHIASVHSCAAFSPEVLCAQEAAAIVSDEADVQVVDSGSASAATGMVLFRLICHWADSVPFREAVSAARELASHVRLLVIPTASAPFGRRRRRRASLIERATSSLRARFSGERGLYLVSGGEVTQLARSGDLTDLTGRLAHAMSSVASCEGPLVYSCVETGDARALRALEKPLDTNEFEARSLGTLRVTPPVEELIGTGAVGVALAPASDYWRAGEKNADVTDVPGSVDSPDAESDAEEREPLEAPDQS